MKTGTIYGLVDPRTNKIKYIGQTKRPLNYRLSNHLSEAKIQSRQKGKIYNTRKLNWINKLFKLNLIPFIIEIESGILVDNLDNRERYWISVYSKNDLVNATIGGQDIICNKIIEYKKAKELKPVFSFNEITKEIIKYEDKKSAANIFKIDYNNITKVISAKSRCCGLFWAYNSEDFKHYNIVPDKKLRPVVIYNAEEMKEFRSVRDAMRYLNISMSKHNPIQARLQGKLNYFGKYKGTCGPYSGYYWKYKEEANLKLGELLETPEEDNQQPSLGSK